MATRESRANSVLDMPGKGSEERSLPLSSGRTITVTSPGPSVAPAGAGELIEIRSPAGQVELRIKLTDDGPVLQLDGVRLSMNATDAIEMRCKTLSVDASESVQLVSRGTLGLRSEGSMEIESPDDVRVRGDNLYLNCDSDFTPQDS